MFKIQSYHTTELQSDNKISYSSINLRGSLLYQSKAKENNLEKCFREILDLQKTAKELIVLDVDYVTKGGAQTKQKLWLTSMGTFFQLHVSNTGPNNNTPHKNFIFNRNANGVSALSAAFLSSHGENENPVTIAEKDCPTEEQFEKMINTALEKRREKK